jgi:predicted ribosomally synthesized peptide with SipW-like signal peptide
VDTPPSGLHVVINLGAVAAAIGVAAGDGTGLGETLAAQPLAGVPLLLLVGVGTYAAFTALTVVPQLRLVGADRTDPA